MCFAIKHTFNISCLDYYNTYVCLYLTVENNHSQFSISVNLTINHLFAGPLCKRTVSALRKFRTELCSSAKILHFVLVLHLPVAYSIITGPNHKQTQWTAKKKKVKQIEHRVECEMLSPKGPLTCVGDTVLLHYKIPRNIFIIPQISLKDSLIKM